MLPLDHRFRHDGQSIAWGCIGDGDPVVLIHGFPWSSQAWRRIAPWLAARHRVYYFDMIGCGQSEQAAGQDVSPAVQNVLLAALFDHWSLERPRVVGHDFGGLAALRGYFVDGLRYGSLTLVDAVAVLPSGSPFFAHVRDHEAAFAGLPAYAHEALFRAYIQNAARRPLAEDAFDIYARPWRGEVGQPAFYRQIAQMDLVYTDEVQDQYGAIRCPVKLLWGTEDAWIPLDRGRELAAMIPGCELTEIPGSGHLMQEDAPEAITAAAVKFLAVP